MSFSQIDLFADGFIQVVGARGLPAFSVAAVARWARLTPQAVLQDAGGRDGFVLLVTQQVAQRWSAWATGWDAELPVALPATDEERTGVRAWGSLVELARAEWAAGRSEAAEVVVEALARERTGYQWRLQATRPPLPEELDSLICLLDGVRSAMARTIEPMALERGQSIVRGWLTSAGLMHGSGAA
jgi:hypothetical protein